MNNGNLAQKTTWKFGSNKLKIFNVFLQEFSIPGISFSSPEIYAKAGAVVNLYADNITFNELNCNLIIDENYKLYFELMQYVFNQIRPELRSHADQSFDVFVILTDNKGHDIFKIDFYNCRISSIGDISLSTQGDEPYNTLDVTFKYDYFLIENLDELAEQGIPSGQKSS